MNRQERRAAHKRDRQGAKPGRPPPSLARSPEAAFAAAVRFLQSGQSAEAERACRATLAEFPDHAFSLLMAGILAIRGGRRDDAAALLMRAAAQDVREPDFHNNLGNALAELGRLNAAHDQFARAHRLKPDNPQILYNLANILAATGDPSAASEAFQKTLAIAPGYVEAHINLGNLLAQHGRADDAMDHFRSAIALRPASAEAHNNLGFLLNEMDRHGEAVPCFEKALAIKSDYPHAHNNLGNAHLALGATEAAIASYRAALKLEPNYVNALSNLSNALATMGQYEDAMVAVERALALEPGSAPVYNGRGGVLLKLGRLDEAAADYERAIGLRPTYADAWANLAAVRNEMGLHEKAIRCCDQAIAIDRNHVSAHSNRGVALVALQRFDEALESHHRALAINPKLGDLHCNIGSALVEQGRLDEALVYFEQAIAVEPRRPKFHLCHVLTRRVTPGDARIATLESLARDEAGMPPESRIDLHFALAKAYADTARHDDSLRALLIGNALKRKSVPYDEAVTIGNLERFAQVWTRETVEAWGGMGHPSVLPLFILGMPRSGSTLVEQILASHPAFAARGELGILHDAAQTAFGPLQQFEPAKVPAQNRAALLDRMAAAYLASLGPAPPGVERIIDKTLGNFAFIPLIRAALPNARIIHTRRDPLDTCLSCFASHFTSVAFSYDLGELGRYYRAYESLMRHWREAMPPQTFLDVDYETLVADFETQARRIVAYCGLPWDDRCLSFHTTDRPVKTASAIQVRQPLYATSVGRWRKIDPTLLAPLRAAIEG